MRIFTAVWAARALIRYPTTGHKDRQILLITARFDEGAAFRPVPTPVDGRDPGSDVISPPDLGG
jgi:hypothetical protein